MTLLLPQHDLWLMGKHKFTDSIEKLQALLRICDEEGVRTAPLRIGQAGDGSGGALVVPLLSWHHQSFDSEPDITHWEAPPSAGEPLGSPRPTGERQRAALSRVVCAGCRGSPRWRM